MEKINETVSRSWFVVLNHPEDNGYTGTPEKILENLKADWLKGSETRSGAWVYCISKDGLNHVHMVLEDNKSMRFSKIKKAYPASHIEPTKGNKKQVEAYIKKEPPFDEKGEQIIATVTHGEISAERGATSNSKHILNEIEVLMDNGKTPCQIMDISIYYRNQEALIRKEFFARRYRGTPAKREVKVYWHVGDSGSGKSYSYVKLCEEYGDDSIYMMNDYNKNSGLDFYCAENILFMDEFKGNLPYQILLNMLEGYRVQIHCRYANAYALWDTVHITSIFPPEEAYSFMVDSENRAKDTVKQLLRRISVIIYHWKDDNGEYHSFEMDMKDYTDYNDLRQKATGNVNGFIPLEKDVSTPFDFL